MFIVKYYIIAAVAFLLAALSINNVYLSIFLLWISLSLAAVSFAYVADKPKIFRKRDNGKIPFYTYWLFVPFLLGAQIYNWWARRNDKVPALQKIDTNLYLACRLFPSDIAELEAQNINAILDCTAEFSGLDWSTEDKRLDYLNIAILDHKAPKKEDLNHAISWLHHKIQQNQGVVVHCALGRGRSVMIVAAYLLAIQKADSVKEVMELINNIRGTARLNGYQYDVLEKLHQQGKLRLNKKMLLIANPISGGGKWPEHKSAIINQLSEKYSVQVQETKEDVNASQISKAYFDEFDIFIACGGDGTVNEVAKTLIHSDKIMGIIPLGTTNALAHVLIGNLSKFSPINTACDAILDSNVRSMDTAKCNEDIVLLLAGLGIEQEMIESADRGKKNESGELAYLNGFVQSLMTNNIHHYHIELDSGVSKDIEVSSLVIANAAPFTTVLAQGNGEPDPFDGQLDITAVDGGESTTSRVASLGFNALTDNSLNEVDGITHMHAKSITVSAIEEIHFAVDGELRQAEKVKISIAPNSLKVICIQKTDEQN